ncbi:MAG: transcriptional regulator NrdR [Rickettsiales bacterium]|nr:transcriptional regulator NrdR [Rickettsiales bacterium]
MKCPFCGHLDTQVKDSRAGEEGESIRRRRNCPSCDSRFTTYERVQLRELTVVKNNGDRKALDRDKIHRSISIATRKRPVEPEQVTQLVNRIMRSLETSGESEIKSTRIGELVMDGLQTLDKVAYIRYASVYRNFREARDFETFVESLQGTLAHSDETMDGK